MAGYRGKGAVSVGQLVGGKGQSLHEPPSYIRVHMYYHTCIWPTMQVISNTKTFLAHGMDTNPHSKLK